MLKEPHISLLQWPVFTRKSLAGFNRKLTPSGQWKISARYQRFHLNTTTDIQLTAIWAPGELLIPAVLSTPTNDPEMEELSE